MKTKSEFKSLLKKQDESFLVAEFQENAELLYEESEKFHYYQKINFDEFQNVKTNKVKFLFKLIELEKCIAESRYSELPSLYKEFYEIYFRDAYTFDEGNCWKKIKHLLEGQEKERHYLFDLLEKEVEIITKIFTSRKHNISPPLQSDLETIIELYILKDELETLPSTLFKYFILTGDDLIAKKYKNSLYKSQSKKNMDNFTITIMDKNNPGRREHREDVVVKKEDFVITGQEDEKGFDEKARVELKKERDLDYMRFIRLDNEISSIFLFKKKQQIILRIEKLYENKKISKQESLYYKALAFYRSKEYFKAWEELNRIDASDLKSFYDALELKNKCREKVQV